MDERERLFRELVRCYRRSAVGQRCTGIVHNLNTPLQALSLGCELLFRKAAEENAALVGQLSPEAKAAWEKFYLYRLDKLQQFEEEIRKLHQLARLIIYQGMHEEQQERQVIDLNALLQDELQLFMLQPFFKHRVEKRIHIQQRLPPISGYYIDFSQSFRNLVDNALEAMATVERPVLTVETALTGQSRIIRVGDNGAGIAPELQPRIFEPFFTTRDSPEHPRTGLGLYMAKRLLAPYGGDIQVQSQSGETWFTVILP